MQRDPIGYYDSMNLYEYVGNNPINFIDPTGLQTAPIPVGPWVANPWVWVGFGGGYAIWWTIQHWSEGTGSINIPWGLPWLPGFPLTNSDTSQTCSINLPMLAKSNKDDKTKNNKKKNKEERTSEDVQDMQDKYDGIKSKFGKIGQRAKKTLQNINEYLKKQGRKYSN